ncbi:hypothetical protein [Herbaspirillum sp. YR522]|uniref:hypothetical protein n=1 Tax=Herbaspirillum sp. YR522 TaxID=1144342 RepID=UPI00026F99F1|nr:hypothetical protein [Herbaspirillum sp. YR522]EJN02940.1 hypothetical protein PMI40_02893 [Herbaspirillum sp. YR522]
MKNADPIDLNCQPEHPPTAHPEPRSTRRLRQELESRILLWRRGQAEPVDQAEDSTGPAAPEPLIGASAAPVPVPIGVSGSAAGGVLAGQDLVIEQDEPASERIVGSGDRMHHLALVAGHAVAQARRRPLPRDSLVLPAGPKSRAECRRRCGKAGFCDPSSDLGCGGQYCDNATAAARQAL